MQHPASGILNRPPGHLLLAAFTLTAGDPAAVRATLERLRSVQERELRSDLDEFSPASPKDQPPAETGELGTEDGYDRAFLTITVGLAKSAFDKLGIAPEEQPQDLVPIPWGQLGDAPQVADNGDVVVQACSDSMYVNEHVLRRIQEELGGELALAWVVQGHQRYNSRQGRTSREEGRALIGFLDGTSNLDPRGEAADRELVFVDPDRVGAYPPLPSSEPGQPSPYGGSQPPQFPPDLRPPPGQEPAWTRNGTYMAARASTIDTATWDRETLGAQEATIGRFRHSGAALDLADDPAQLDAEPAFAANQSDERVAIHAHVRKANPRGPDDGARRIFRRGYPLIDSTVTGLSRGLVFVAFGRTLSTQFEFITRAWLINENFPRPGAGADPLRRFEQVLCGGYFFVPAIETPNRPWTWVLPAAAS